MKKKVKAQGKSRFWTGLLVGGALAGTAVYWRPEIAHLFADASPAAGDGKPAAVVKAVPEREEISPPPLKSKSKPAAPVVTSSGNGSGSGIAFFRRPDLVVGFPARMGMRESYPGSLAWKKTDALGWNSFGILSTAKGSASKGGEADNSITCLFESVAGDAVEVMRLTANVADPGAATDTIGKFQSVCLGFLNEVRCPVTKQFVDAIGAGGSMKTETPEGYFALGRVPVGTGYRVELTVRSK